MGPKASQLIPYGVKNNMGRDKVVTCSGNNNTARISWFLMVDGGNDMGAD